MKHNKVVRKEFSKQAPSFGDKGLTLSSQDILDWSVRILPLDKEFRVLDVAAGTGFHRDSRNRVGDFTEKMTVALPLHSRYGMLRKSDCHLAINTAQML